ncbi:unnamed protein product [Protopolystoma xenopodis]|uniref:Uncharacterized protein n=1 Tax=Protopolystoma xenopodis TaxID=117903 RepID=A0A3S5CRB0_9PLAT|nr:unnamed protein product [Protopolystoma xenopodis]
MHPATSPSNEDQIGIDHKLDFFLENEPQIYIEDAKGPNCPYDKLDAIREQQEELMRLHFELDQKMQSTFESGSSRNRRQARW